MRRFAIGLCLSTILATPAVAGDTLMFGPPPKWVVPATAAVPPAASDSNAVTILLDDQQALLEKGVRHFYSGSTYRIESSQGLDAGNISITWDPVSETATVNRLLIHRGNTVIDPIKVGQKFTTIRRETNLEAGMFDGQLTATIQPEDLRVGDIVELQVTIDRADAALKDQVETEIATFNGSPIGHGHARLSWPASLPIFYRTTQGLLPPKVTTKDGMSSIDYDLNSIEPLIVPDSAPARYRDGRALDASSFRSWSDIASLMKPYFDAASVVPKTGPLRDEVERIRHLPGDAAAHAEAALALVQDDVRYIALNMGTGGYIPANADLTWTRRFGDCKAKTALLLAILRELGISAEAVLANTGGNDGLDQRQPMMSRFNHVLVRAHVGGRDVWMDGTRKGDRSLARLVTPDYDWGLPLVTGAGLTRMMAPPYAVAQAETRLSIDARGGLSSPVPISVDYLFRDDTSLAMNLIFKSQPASQRDKFLRDFIKSAIEDWRNSIISLDVASVTAKYDAETAEFTVSAAGTGKLDWSDGSLYVDLADLGYKPNFERTDGINRQAPIAVKYPFFRRGIERIRLPAAFLTNPVTSPDIQSHLVGYEFHRHVGMVGDTFEVDTSERAIAPEVPYSSALADAAALRSINNQRLALRIPSSYVPNAQEIDAILATTPVDANGYIRRSNLLLSRGKMAEALADVDQAVSLDSTNVEALVERAFLNIERGELDKARTDLATAATVNPNAPSLMRTRAMLNLRTGKLAKARDELTKLIAEFPNDMYSLALRSQVLLDMRDYAGAAKDASTYLQAHPDQNGVRATRGMALARTGQCDDAAKDAAFLVVHSSVKEDRALDGGQIYAVCHRRTEAIAAYDASIAQKPTAAAYGNRSLSRPMSDHAGRLADLDSAIALDPKDPVYLGLKASELKRAGDYGAAIAVDDLMLALDPDNARARLAKAIALFRMGKTDEAARLLPQPSTTLKDADLLNSTCWELATANILLSNALADCQAAVRLDPASPQYLDSLGMAYLRLGRFDEAIDAYDKAVAGGSGAMSLIGRSLARAGKGQAALAAADRKAGVAADSGVVAAFEGFGLKP